jgi:hypothetical protein
MDQIVKIGPLPVPTERVPTPSLPAWVTSRQSVLAPNLQLDASGKWGEPLTLPTAMLPADGQREAIENHIRHLNFLLLQTPQLNEEWEKKTFVAIGKLMLVKPARAGGPEAAEARAEAYSDALDDVPHWGVTLAIRKWHRGECGTNEHGEPYDYRWAPESADLRRLARREAREVRARVEELERLLGAVAFRDCSAELARGRAAYRGLLKTVAGAGDVKTLTFDEAVRLGGQEGGEASP